MGESCGNNGGSYFDESDIYKKWYNATSIHCPMFLNNFSNEKNRGRPNPQCPSGCATGPEFYGGGSKCLPL